MSSCCTLKWFLGQNYAIQLSFCTSYKNNSNIEIYWSIALVDPQYLSFLKVCWISKKCISLIPKYNASICLPNAHTRAVSKIIQFKTVIIPTQIVLNVVITKKQTLLFCPKMNVYISCLIGNTRLQMLSTAASCIISSKCCNYYVKVNNRNLARRYFQPWTFFALFIINFRGIFFFKVSYHGVLGRYN